MRRLLAAVIVLSAFVACGDDDDGEVSAAETSTSVAGSSAGESNRAADASEGEEGYRPASNVDAHSAIGQDIADMREAMDPATKDEEVDWVAVGDLFEKGGASKKGDGSIRTLAGLLAESETIESIRQAIAGTGEAKGTSDAVRRQQVDKGISVLLAEKVVQELGAARGKIEADDLTPPATGAVHNVDEAWAFFAAEGQGPSVTAEKRAADFQREGTVKEPVLDALSDAKTAALEGDLATFDAAVEETKNALAYIFYLATYKYLDNKNEVTRAEGISFYRGIATAVEAADAKAHQAILAAFESGDAAAGRDALNADAVLAALGVSKDEKVPD